MAHATPQDPPQYVSATVVRRKDAVGEEEGDRPGVIGDYTERDPFLGVLRVRAPDHRCDLVEQGHEQVGVVVAPDTLHDRRQSLQPQTGIDTRGRKWVLNPVFVAVELHEDEVPQLEELARLSARLEFGRRQHGPPFLPGAHVMVHLGARTAGARIGHLPEVVLVSQPVDSLGRDPGHFDPELCRFIVGVVDGDEETVHFKPHLDRQEVPGVPYGLPLEVVTEGKVAQHLEERVVPCRSSDFFKIVVLAPRAHAFLRGDGPRKRQVPGPQKRALELNHPGVREEQCRVVGGHQR